MYFDFSAYQSGISSGNTEYGYSLDYIDGDDIPELVIDHMSTAEYKNANSELVIKFDLDYQQLEMEGYMDTIDLTGSYIGRWG